MSYAVIGIIKRHKAKAVSALALVAAGCASHRDFAYYDGQYPPAYYSEASYRDGGPDFGIDAARRAHRLYPEYKAERLDGHCERSIRIRRGETLSDIAEFCDVPVASLIDANPQIRNPREVAAGEQIFVPPVKGHVYAGSNRYLYRNSSYTDNYTLAGLLERDGSRDYYIVRRGDTLAQISYMYDVPLYEIEDLNPGLRPRSLGVGDRVYLPEYARLDPSRRAHHHRRDALAGGPPVISIYPVSGPRDGRIHVIGDNFRPFQDVTVYYGDGRDDLGRLQVAEANGDGRIDRYLNLPDSYAHDEAYFAVRGRDNSYVMSEPYAIDDGYDGRDGRLAAEGPYRDGYQLDGRGPGPRLSALDHYVYRGDRVRLSADGFPPDTPVSIYGGPSRSALIKVAETRSDRRGTFNADVAIPDNVNDDSALFVAAIEDGARTIYSDKVRVRTRDGGGRYNDGYDDGYVSSAYPLDESRIDNGYAGRAQLERGVDHGGLLDSGLFSRFRHHNLRREININSGGESAISGVLTNEGVDCPALRDDAGNLYSLLGDLHGFDNGDRVLVKGSTAADNRICGQAQTIQVFSIEKAPW